MAFTSTMGRYASFGTIASIPGDVIDLFWTIIDLNLKGVIDLEPIINFELLNRKGKLSVRFSQSGKVFEMVVDTDHAFNSEWPRHFHAVDQMGRETIMTPREI